MKRKLELTDVVAATRPNGDRLIGDVRIRVDLTALALALGPKAIKTRGKRITLYGGALEVDGFNPRTVYASPEAATAGKEPSFDL